MKKKSKNKNRRSRAAKRFFCCLLAALCVWYVSNYTLKVNNIRVKTPLIGGEIKIVHISDLHGLSFGKGNKRLTAKISACKPDIIAITGDMYTYNDEKGKKTALDFMLQLPGIAPVYYISGEHDYYDKAFFQSLEKGGVNVYNYKSGVVKIRDDEIRLYGINNVEYSQTFDLSNAFLKDSSRFSLLLAHASNFAAFSDFGADLSLCGDTHGGMFRLPIVGAVYDGETFFPDIKGKYIKGLYEKGESKLFVTGGLGNYPAPLRFCNRPEIAVITLEGCEG